MLTFSSRAYVSVGMDLTNPDDANWLSDARQNDGDDETDTDDADAADA